MATIWSNKEIYHWGSAGYIKLDATYDYYRSGADMYYNISVTVKQTGSGSWFNDKVGCQIKLDGVEVYYNATLKDTTSSSTKTWSRTANVQNAKVANKTTGTTALSVKVWDSQGEASFNVTNTANLAVSAAMPVLTVGAPSAAINYANFTITDATGQTMTKYEIANSAGTTVQSGALNGSSATIKFSEISGTRLSQGTTYSGYKIRAENSIGWGDYAAIPDFTTANLPNASTSGDFNIGNNTKITITSTNYISSWSVSASDGTTTKTGTGSGTECTVAVGESSYVTSMLNNHPKNTSWQMTYIVHLYSDNVYAGSRTVYNTCSIPSGSYNPTFTSDKVNYKDTNKTITDITKDDQKIIRGYSNVEITVKPMTPGTGATASKYKVTANGTSQEATHTGSDLKFTFNSVSSNEYSAQAIDSRSKSTTVTGKYSTFINYVKPAFTVNNIKRTDQGVGTNINIDAYFSYYNWSNLPVNNDITSVKYKVGSGNWVTLTPTTDYTASGGTLHIIHTTTSGSFSQDASYTVTLFVQDKLSSYEASVTIPSAQPLLWKDRLHKWLGIKKKPTCELDVNGNANINGNLSFQQTGSASGSWKGVYGNIADNDQWMIRGSQTASNQGYLEIATGDDGNEPIYVRQYGVSGAASPSTTTPGTNCRTLTLLDSSGNTTLPGNLNVGGKSLLDNIYPVGSIYLSVNTTNPGTLFGGTWERITDGYLWATSSSNGGGKGGSLTTGSTALTVDQIPAHGHSIASSGAHKHVAQGRTSSGSTTPAIFESFAGTGGTRNVNVPRSGTDGAHTHTASDTGGGQGHTHSINPSYVNVIMWKRTG